MTREKIMEFINRSMVNTEVITLWNECAESKVGRKTTDKERIDRIKEIISESDDIHAMAYELHRLELAIELGREVV